MSASRTPHVYVESDIPEGVTLAEYRRNLDAERREARREARRARLEDFSWPAIRVGRGPRR